MNRLLSFFSGVVMGGLLGATLGILLAPTSGENLRLQMREGAQRLQEDVKSAAVARRVELESQLESLRAPRQPL